MTEPERYFAYWGKARPADDESVRCHLLPFHCLDVAAVAHVYVRRHAAFRRSLRVALGFDDEDALPNWLAFWVALHDIGKFAESFQGQRPDLFAELRGRPPHPAKPYRVRHDSLGMLFWNTVLSGVSLNEGGFGATGEVLIDGLDYWARAVMGHHGQPPEAVFEAWTAHFDKSDDRPAILEFVAEARRLFLPDGGAGFLAKVDPTAFWQASRDVSWWLAGLTVLADWLGSNAEYFPYRAEKLALAEYWPCALSQAEKAIAASGVFSAGRKGELGFAELFPGIASPSPLQDWARSAVLREGPQIYLLEDVTGAGKTEAAVLLAHRLMSAGHADGFFISP